MAQTSVGFAGTVLDADWAAMAHMLGTKYCVEDAAALAATQVAASRNVSIAAGSAFGRGVKTTLSAPESVTIASPVAGQWYLVALRRTWATKVTALVALPSTTTTTTPPDPTSASVPTTATGLTNTPGTVDDQPVCWVWVRNTDTTQIIVDARRIYGQNARPRVASSAARSALFSGVYSAATDGDEVYRTDRKMIQRHNGTAWATVPHVASHVSLEAAQLLTTNSTSVDTAVVFDTVQIDSGAFTFSSGVLTCVTPGTYLVRAWNEFAGTTLTGIRQVRIQQALAATPTTWTANERAGVTAPASAALAQNVLAQGVFTVAAGDKIRVSARQNSGGNLNLVNSGLELARAA